MKAGLMALGCVTAAIVVSLTVLGLDHTLIVVAVLAAITAGTWAGTEALIRDSGRRRPVSSQLATVIAVVVVPTLISLLILGLLMFVSEDDAVLVGVIVALSAVLGIAAALRLSNVVVDEITTVRDGLVAVGHGDRKLLPLPDGATELRDLVDAANVMIERLTAEEAARDQSEAARRHLVASASHDLRTPITSLQLLAAALDDEIVEGPLRREYVQRMLTHIGALSSLIDDLFELSRIEAGDISWTLEQVAVGELVIETVDALRVQADAKGVLVTADLPSRLALARGNPEKLQRVLFNLIQNAIRHSPADGSVVVRAETLADVVEVEVEDAGTGIPVNERELVFDAFYRGDSARTTTGAGLGLAVARAIVEAHGGQIWLPAGNVGTRVRFSVPAITASDGSSAPAVIAN